MWRRRDRGECQVLGCDVRGSIEWVGSWETLRVGARCADLFSACMSWSLDAESVVRCGVECGEGFSREEQTAGCGAGAFERLRGEPLS